MFILCAFRAMYMSSIKGAYTFIYTETETETKTWNETYWN